MFCFIIFFSCIYIYIWQLHKRDSKPFSFGKKNIIAQFCSGQIIIGINDLVKEGVWTSFDGTPVSNLPWYPGQPEGHRDENCVWIERNPFTLRDKSCSDKCHNFLCYNDGKISSPWIPIFNAIFVKRKWNGLFSPFSASFFYC